MGRTRDVNDPPEKVNEFDRLKQKIDRRERRKLMGVETREVFVDTLPELNEMTKTLVTITTFVLAGSLTFLGLRENFGSTDYLRLAWVLLAAGILFHILTRVAILEGKIAHGRTESDTQQAERIAEAEGINDSFVSQVLKSFYYQGKFFTIVRYLHLFLVVQVLLTIAGVVCVGMFVLDNI